MIKEIDKTITAYSDSAKIQQIGTDAKGNPKFMVYITGLVNKAAWKKGDRIVIDAYKLTETTQVVRNPSPSVGIHNPGAELSDTSDLGDTAPDTTEIKKNEDGTQEVVVDHSSFKKRELVLTEEEKDFKQRYENLSNPQMASFILKQAEDNFGEKRIKEILEVEE